VSSDPYTPPNNSMLAVLRKTFATPEPPADFQTLFQKFNRELSQIATYPNISLYVVPDVEKLAPEFLDMLTIRNQHRDPEIMAATEKSLIRAQHGRRRIALAAAALAILIPNYLYIKHKSDDVQRTVQETKELIWKMNDAEEHPEKYSPEEEEKMVEEYKRLIPKLQKHLPK